MHTAVVVGSSLETCANLQSYLEYWGIKVTCFTSAAESTQWLSQSRSTDFLFVDSHLRDDDGMAFATSQHARCPNLPIIVLTNIADTHLRANRQIGSSRLLVKPIKPMELYDTLIEILGASKPRVVANPIQPNIVDDMGARFPLRVLLAEDNMLNQKVALRMLKRLGYEADIANDGIQALHAAEVNSYDVILMDVQMPEMDGLEATRQIRLKQVSSSQQPYIIAMTAAAMELDREKCLEAGMNDFISKPATLEDLQRAIQRCLGQPESA